MFEEFSASYYVGRFYIELYDGVLAVMDRAQHKEANEQVYSPGTGIERLDSLLVMKVDEHHVPVFAADDVPMDTPGLPKPVLEATRVDIPPTLKEVLVAKAEHAVQLLKWATLYTIQKPEFA